MSMENNENLDVTDDTNLDDFEADFFGRNEAPSEQTNSEEVEEEDAPEDIAPEEDTQNDEDDTLDTEDEDETDEEEEEVKSAPKPKKNRFQERIDEVVGKQREAERRAEDLERKLNEAIEQLNSKNNKEPEPSKPAQVADGPTPDDKNDDGTDKYPLGEFDPTYIRDLTRFTLQQEREADKARDAEQARDREVQAAREALQESWQEKTVSAQERYPDFREKGEELIETFSSIEQSYGEYLAATIMDMEYGPDVLYYLSNNKDEAAKIVNSGPARATRDLYHLEAKFALAEEEKAKARPKVSKAPAPPSHRNKGSAVSMPDVADDTDDLDLFEKKFFK